MIGRVARLHYQHGFTHQQIADILGLSRVKVTRLLAEARRTGIVEIRVHSDESIFTALELELVERFGLTQAWVAPSFEDRDRRLSAIGTAGALALRAALHPGMTVAVGLSETVAALAPHVTVDEPSGVLFVPATGSRLGPADGAHPHEVAQALAHAFRGQSRHLPAPALASSPETARLLRREPDVEAALRLARRADVVVVGVGGTSPGASMLMDGVLQPDTVRELIDAGAVGGISAGFYDASGSPVDTSLAHRLIGLSLTEILAPPVRIALAGGPGKREALLGALAGGYLTVLVTDERTARALCDAPSP